MEQVGIILSYANTLKSLDINYQTDLLVEAIDISDICVYMTYLQLSLYGIPAIIHCGNALTQDYNFSLHTPSFICQYMKFSNFYTSNKNQDIQNTEKIENDIDTKPIILNQNLYKEVTIKGNSQFSLW